jgi:anti-sigma B factor antagonist
MIIKTEAKRSGTFVLKLTGHVDYGVSPEVRKAVGKLCEEDTRRIIVDFTMVDFIDSSGIATLLERQHQSRKRGVRFTLVGISPRVKAAFDLANLKNVFEMVSGVEETLLAEDVIALENGPKSVLN